MKLSPSRVAAFEILFRIEKDRAFSSVLLPQFETELSAQDKSLCHTLVLGTLRNQILLDRHIAALSDSKKIDLAIRIILRLGLFQLYFLDKIPPYSAIDEAVNLAKYVKKTSAKGFVNAILRRASRARPLLEFADELERISVETSHPRWLLERWIEQFGFENAANIAKANNQIPRTAFRTTAKTVDEEQFDESERSQFVANCYFAESSSADLREMADCGEIYFQGEASQMVAAIAGKTTGSNFIDLCAAPGSKATAIARMRDGLVVAGDYYAARVATMHQSSIKQGIKNLSILRYDATQPLPFADESFDVVLIDAPCSGTGTIRQNPEIRHFLATQDITELAAKQRAIIKHASYLVKRGGKIIYSTCSLENEENAEVCEDFLTSIFGFEKLRPDLDERFISPDGYARIFPHRDKMDGFFVAVLGRTA